MVLDVPMPQAGCMAKERICRNGKAVHPCQKPLAVILPFVERAGADTILDPFAGSGTTGVAAKRLGRRCILIEIEEKYCEIIKNRLANEPMPLFTDDGNGKPKDVQGELSLA
jgi:DNA modification methylase